VDQEFHQEQQINTHRSR